MKIDNMPEYVAWVGKHDNSEDRIVNTVTSKIIGSNANCCIYGVGSNGGNYETSHPWQSDGYWRPAEKSEIKNYKYQIKEKKPRKMALAGVNKNSANDFFFCCVKATDDEVVCNMHVIAARNYAFENEGFGPCVTYDENSPCWNGLLAGFCNWDEAPVIDIN